MRWASCPILRPGTTAGAIAQHEVVYEKTALRLYGKRDLRLETFDLPECRRMKSSRRWSPTACASLPERGQSG